MGSEATPWRRTYQWWSRLTRDTETRPRASWRWVRAAALPVALIALTGVSAMLPMELSRGARWTLFTFVSATVLWCFTSLNTAFVSVAAVLVLIGSGSAPQSLLGETLSADIVWLMIGAFIVAAGVRACGIGDRFAGFIVSRARTVRGVFWSLSLAVFPLALIIPSTTARAAIGMPFFRSVADQLDDRRIVKALAILVPAIVLTSTCLTLTAATSHLISNDFLHRHAGVSMEFVDWLVLAAPFAVASSILTCWVILVALLDRQTRRRRFRWRPLPRPRISRGRTAYASGVGLAMIALWMTTPQHGFSIATVTIAGAVMMCMPRLGPISWQKGAKAVSWNLVVFTGCALALGQQLLDQGVASWLADGLLSATRDSGGGDHLLSLIILAAVTLTAHIYIPSHAIRATVLIPPLLASAPALGLEAVALVFITNMGLDYCLTFPVSSKAILLFTEHDEQSLEPPDLLRISAILLPLHLLLMVAMYYLYWAPMGLTL